MISNQILQSTIEGIKNISRVELCVTDVEGKVLVTTFPEVEISQNDIVTFAQSQADSQTMKNYQDVYKRQGYVCIEARKHAMELVLNNK